jgi:rhomboid protease GluP
MTESDSAGKQTFAAYLARHYIARKGFTAGTVPEAKALADACDLVLTHADGMSIQIVGIVDTEAHPGRTFGMTRDALAGIATKCLKYCGSVNRTKMPAVIQIMEIGPGSASDEDRRRLGALKRPSLFSKAVLTAWKLDTTAKTAWTNAPFNGFFVRRPLERLMREPRLADADLRQPEVALARQRFPLVTIALLAVLAAAFACEHRFAIGESSGLLAPSIQTLVALGALNKTLVLQSGEWYRLLSAALLHADLIHLAMNGLCLYLAGTVLESLIGRRWFFSLFVIGALGGSLLSLALNAPSVVSVGASGAIMGLLAAAFVCSFRYPPGALRTQIQMTSLQVLIPSLIPLAVSRTGQQVDFAGHLGGALAGAAAGLAMLKTWRSDSAVPGFTPLATAISIAGLAAFGLAFVPIAREFPSYTLDALLIPDDQLPKSNAEAKAKSADLSARYPRDPRAHLWQAITLLDRKDPAAAEIELRAGLAEERILKTRLKPELEARMRGMLALILFDRNQSAEAKAAAQPACGMTADSFAALRELLLKAHLCEK